LPIVRPTILGELSHLPPRRRRPMDLLSSCESGRSPRATIKGICCGRRPGRPQAPLTVTGPLSLGGTQGSRTRPLQCRRVMGSDSAQPRVRLSYVEGDAGPAGMQVY
jgi:hypothetical protein